MKKKTWTFHRPAVLERDSPRPKGSTALAGRWTFHDPTTTLGEAEGTGWHAEEAARWTCDYGCKSFVWSQAPQPGQYHAYDCPYWDREGKLFTPF